LISAQLWIAVVHRRGLCKGKFERDLGSAKSFAKSQQQRFLSLQQAGADDYTGAFSLFQRQEFMRPARPNNGPRRRPMSKLFIRRKTKLRRFMPTARFTKSSSIFCNHRERSPDDLILMPE
jgi:hypothetical protein